jgi:PAS domain S-box-containing protein
MVANRTELVLDRAHNAVVSMDQRGLVTYWNPSAAAMFGISRSDALGRPVADLIVPERFRGAHNAGLQRFLSEGVGPVLDQRIEMAALRQDGREFPIEMTISALRERGAWMFTAFIQDISARKESERQRERLVQELRQALHGSERLLDAILGSLSDPVTIRSRDDRLLYANQAALVHLGLESVDQVRATSPTQIMDLYDVFGADGSEISMDEIPSVRLLRGQPADPLLIRAIDHRTGVERWSLLKAAPVLDEAGELEATIMFTEDVTEQKRAERRAAFLAQASEVLASSLDYEQTLRNVAELAVPDVVDWCAVDLLDEDGDRVSVAVAHADPARLKLAEELRAYEPEELDPEHALGLVLRTGEAALYPEISDEMLAAGAVDERHLELLRSVGFCSAAVVPMRIGSRTLGAMTLVTAESRRTLNRSDVELAELIAARAAVAIENSRVYSERSKIAHTLQQSLLPQQLPEIPGYELASVYIPAFESTEVGGDFYDVWETGGSWIVTIGDVTGKGVEAAALTSLVRHTMRAISEFVSSPAELLARLDAILKKQPERSICTAICLRLDDHRVTLAIGGHPLPIHITPDGARQIGTSGPLLGAFDGVEWHELALDLAPDSKLVIYTDGMTDAVGSDGERYGLGRLQATLDRCRELSAPAVIETLTEALGRFQAGEHADDTAALVLRRASSGSQRTRPQQSSQADPIETVAA